MYTEILSRLSGTKLNKWERFIEKAGLLPDLLVEKTVIVWNEDEIAATGSRYDNILKLIAVDPSHRGEDLTSTVISELRRDAFGDGYRHLFLYTKPENEAIFTSLFFYPIAKTEKVLLLEDKKDGIKQFVENLPLASVSGRIGAIVMNCNPFTLGHRYLVERAAEECDFLYVFILSEDKSEFLFEDRFEMVKLGTAHLQNVSVVETGPYLISSATFPAYFIKDRDSVADAQCRLDIEVFIKHFVKPLGITHRYVGTEPLSPLTNAYNDALLRYLPERGVELVEIQRKTHGSEPISASRVRQLISNKEYDGLGALLPETTVNYLKQKGFI